MRRDRRSGEHPLSPSDEPTSRRRVLVSGGAALGAAVLGSPAIDRALTGGFRHSPLWRHLERALEVVPRAPQIDGWYAGDLHVHTDHSHDVCDRVTCADPFTYGFSVDQQLLAAELRGLDYLAITDHDTVAAHGEAGYDSGTVTLLDGYEHSMANGHAGFLGVEAAHDNPSETVAEATALIDRVRDAGGVAIANHPRTDISSQWGYPSPLGVDAVEVWSIAWYLQEATTGGVLASNNPDALRLYDRYLNAGHRLGVVGGSDNHWRSSSLLQGVGQPTTWIKADSPSQRDLLEGIRAGRTAVSWDWLGPVVTLSCETAVGETGGVGDVIDADGSTTVTVRVRNGVGHRVRLVSDGDVLASRWIRRTPATWTVDLDLEDRSWLRAEALLEERVAIRALTSPVYLTRTDEEPETVQTAPAPATSSSTCGCHTREQRLALAEMNLDLGLGRATGSYWSTGALSRALERAIKPP